MLFSRTLFRSLLVLGLFAVLAAPALITPTSAAEYSILPDSTPQVGKGKKGDAPPRPRPKPGPRDGGDDE